jgi:hypothetical protein
VAWPSEEVVELADRVAGEGSAAAVGEQGILGIVISPAVTGDVSRAL